LKALLVAINSKFIHTSLAVRSLSANADNTEFVEYSINEEIHFIISSVFAKKPDAICFSCYIWNIEYVLKIASVLKKMLPDSIIVLGGPEVSFCSEEILEKNIFADAIIRGEGEIVFANLVKSSFNFENVKGITWRGKTITRNDDENLICNLDNLIFPYSDADLKANRNKLIYYESSRGCPYRCSYCLSSTEHHVRFKSVDKVIDELKKIIEYKPSTVKFVDRTFNADKKRTIEILKFIKENSKGITFHFEIEASTLNDEFINLIADAPEGMFRFEIGLQSTNSKTLKSINRKDNTQQILYNAAKIMENPNNIVHLDLISGLPYEDYKTFRKSFNEAISVRPDELQLGFLKLLKGTSLRADYVNYGYKFCDFPPYELIENNHISAEEIIKLKCIENVFDKFYNSGAFKKSCKFLEEFFGDSFLFYEHLSEYFQTKLCFNMQFSRTALYELLLGFSVTFGVDEIFADILKYDYLIHNKNASTPAWSLYRYDEDIHKKRIEIINNNPNLFSVFDSLSVKEILKRVHFEKFKYRVHENMEKSDCILAFSKDRSFLGEINII